MSRQRQAHPTGSVNWVRPLETALGSVGVHSTRRTKHHAGEFLPDLVTVGSGAVPGLWRSMWTVVLRAARQPGQVADGRGSGGTHRIP